MQGENSSEVCVVSPVNSTFVSGLKYPIITSGSNLGPRENIESGASRQMNSRLPAGNFPLGSLFQFSKKRKFVKSPKQNILLTLLSVILPCALALRKEILTEVTCTCVYDQLTKQIACLNCCNCSP